MTLPIFLSPAYFVLPRPWMKQLAYVVYFDKANSGAAVPPSQRWLYEQRLAGYREAAKRWAVAWPTIEKEINGLTE